MKRVGKLWSKIVSSKNLWVAAKNARRGKRFKEAALVFDHDLERNLVALQVELESKAYVPGKYRSFEIFEPKRRLISAAPYRDRVVHHALCNVIVPIFEPTFICDAYANRVGYGTHRALRRFTGFLRSSKHILQCDIRKFFPSIDHEILKATIRRKIKCHDTLWLIDTIIDASNEQEPVSHYFPGDNLLTQFSRRRGLPIGNLTSQLFANVYMNQLDHFIKESIACRKYLRFVDDFALFSDSRDHLEEARGRIEVFLEALRMRLHPRKTQIFSCSKGATVLGFRILQNYIRVKGESLRRAKRRLREIQWKYKYSHLDIDQVGASVRSWIAHLEHGNTWRLREKMFSGLVFTRGSSLV